MPPLCISLPVYLPELFEKGYYQFLRVQILFFQPDTATKAIYPVELFFPGGLQSGQ